jgi:hypothetical protein
MTAREGSVTEDVHSTLRCVVRQVKTLIPILVVVLIVSACGATPSNQIALLEQKTIPPITFHVDQKGVLRVLLDSAGHGATVSIDPADLTEDSDVPGLAFFAATTINVAQVEVNQALDRLETTVLVINTDTNGYTTSSIFRIGTDQELRVTLNGTFQNVEEYFSPREVIVDVPAGQNATIAVSDAYAGERLLRTDHVTLGYRKGIYGSIARIPFLNEGNDSTNSTVNLDNGRTAIPLSEAEIDVNRSDARLQAVNGTTVASWSGADLPSESTCASAIPPSQYHSGPLEAAKAFGQVRGNSVLCVHTPQGRFGLLVIGSASSVRAISGVFGEAFSFHIAYLLWANQP